MTTPRPSPRSAAGSTAFRSRSSSRPLASRCSHPKSSGTGCATTSACWAPRDTRDLPARQQTLQSTIEWSERLLDDDERSIFRLFSVFASARIDAVEAVAARLDHLDGVAVLDRLVSLVDKSLVRSLDEHGHRRLAMLGTIREYAVERSRRGACAA